MGRLTLDDDDESLLLPSTFCSSSCRTRAAAVLEALRRWLGRGAAAVVLRERVSLAIGAVTLVIVGVGGLEDGVGGDDLLGD